MILDLEKLTSDAEKISEDEVVRFRDASGGENRIDCHIDLDVRKVGETFYIHADLKRTFSTPCHRCLESASYEVEPSFDLVVRRSREHRGTGGGEEDFLTLPFGQAQISLDQQIYENLVVNITMQIVCNDQCKGLCPSCGANLNREKCGCQTDPNPRWDALKKLGENLPE